MWLKYNWLKIVFWLFVIGMFAMFIYSLAGCQAKPAPPLPPEPVTQAQSAVIKIITQTNWLVTVGSILCVVGVFTFLNGSTKGVSFVGAGLAAIALAGLVATYFSILTDYRGWILAVFGILTAVGVWYFLKTATGDVNGDGKVNWTDVKDLLRKK